MSKKGLSEALKEPVSSKALVPKKKEKRDERGRPPHKPTSVSRAQVLELGGMGWTNEQIANHLKINRDTLAKYYREELDTALEKTNLRVKQNLYNIAIDPTHKQSVTAAIFWLKTRARWRETDRLELTGPNGGPIEQSISQSPAVDVRNLSPEQRDQLRDILKAAVSFPKNDPNVIDGEIEEDEDLDEEEEGGIEDEDRS
jgi:hypothetical protein